MTLPVVASNIRGCREAVLDGQTGLLVPPRDHRALAQAIAQLIEDPARARAMGAAGRAHVQASFDEALVVDRLIKFYREVLFTAEKGMQHDPARA